MKKEGKGDQKAIDALYYDLKNQELRQARERQFLINRIDELRFENRITRRAYLRQLNS